MKISPNNPKIPAKKSLGAGTDFLVSLIFFGNGDGSLQFFI